MGDIPPPPSGFTLDAPASARKVRASTIPPPPDGFTLDGDAVDGDTFSTEQGTNLRLYGVDAPELKQQGWRRDMTPVAIGRTARDIADGLVDPTGEVGTLHGYSYGRPVAPISDNGVDVGERMIRTGNALAAPNYLKGDARFDYMQAERLARQNRLGMHGTFAQTPEDFRKAPVPLPERETVARFWDTPTPNAGMRPEAERNALTMMNDPTVPVADIVAFARANGFVVNPADIEKSRDHAKRTRTTFGLSYKGAPRVLTDQGDGATGAFARGIGDGVLPNLLDEVGAVPDSLGLTPDRENVFNSDRRWADIWANNTDQNRAIIGFDDMAHPYARFGGELAGGLAIPFGAGAKTIPQLARVGAAYGAVAGFGGGETLPERLTGGVVNAAAGAVITGVGGKALQVGLPKLAAGWRWARGKGGEPVAVPETPLGAPDGAGGLPEGMRSPDRIDIGSLPERTPDAPVVPISTARPARDGRVPDWIDIGEIPPPPPGYRLDGSAARAMAAEPMPSLSAPVRQPDYLDLGQRPRPLLRDATEAERRAATSGIEPSDVLPIRSNEIGSVEEAAARDAGRIVEARAPDERGALTRRTVRGWNGSEVPKLGPIDLIGFLRLRGGMKDQAGELTHIGMNNAARKLDFAGQEHRFGPLVNEEGANLDDAAFAAWEAGYFPELSERPDVATFLDALRDNYSGRNRRFLSEDLPEIETHDALRAERYDLEHRSFTEGAPLYNDRSVPADEPAPFPPVEAYEDWPDGGPDFAGNIRLDKLDSPQDIKRALSTVNNRVGFDAATRGRVTQAETERLAAELGMTPDTLLARRKGQALNAEEALAARQILAKSGNELVNAAKGIRALDNPGDEMLADFQRKLVRHAAIQEQVSGATAEAGRALQQFRMLANSRTVRGEVLSALVARGGGKDRLKDAADVLIDAAETSPGVFAAVAEKAIRPKWKDKLAEIYINALLSFPQTHAVNVTSNTLTSLAQIPEHATAALLGGVRQAFSRVALDRITGSEVGARAFGLLQGAKEGARMFSQSIRTGEASDLVAKVEGEQYKAIKGLKGEVVRIPTRLLTAEDEFFKGVARRMELAGEAVRIARKEGLKGEASKARIAELVANPTDDMLSKAMEYGRYLTFQRKLGPAAQDISNFANRHIAAKVFLPFVRTPTNLIKFAAERSPAAPLLKEWRADFMFGGERRDLAVSRMLLGTGFGLAIYEAALAGNITGSAPTAPSKSRLLYADGWKPYSVKIGDTYYSYKRLDPFATTIGVAADLATLPDGMSDKQREDRTTLLVASIMGNLASKTWLSGVSDVVSALHEPDRYADNLVQRLVGSFLVPNLVAGTARTLDPTARETETMGEALAARIPGLRENLLPRRDVWGRPIVNEGGIGPDFLSPVWMSKALNDPVNHELMQLDYAPGLVPRKVGGVELTAEQYDRYQELAGGRSHAALSTLVTSREWRAMDDEAKEKAAKRTVAKAREDARGELFGGAKGGSAPAGSRAIPPPPAGFAVEGEAGGVNVYQDIQEAIPGVRFTSGFRTPEYQADMRRRGYRPDPNSDHLNGSKLDLLPPPGKSMGWLKDQVRRFRPDAELRDEGDHLDARFPGYFGAPPLGGAKGAGLRNPLAGMPPPPAGFTLDAR